MTLRVPHSISYFSPAARTWVPATTRATQQPGAAQRSATARNPLKHRFDLVSWNIDYSSVQPSRRCLALLKHVLEGGGGVPDILCLQEVTPVVRAAILGSAEIRATFLATDATPNAEDKIFENMTLLSRKRFACGQDAGEADRPDGEEKFLVARVFRQQIPTAMDREGLCVDLVPARRAAAQEEEEEGAAAFLRVVNVHLESLDSFRYRAAQLERLAGALREPGCSGGGVVVGDFNAITDADHRLLEANGLQDAWLMLHGDDNTDNHQPDAAATWNVSRRDSRHEPGRLDKVAVVGLVPESMEIMHPGLVDAPKPGGSVAQVEWSDHSGLRCKFCF